MGEYSKDFKRSGKRNTKKASLDKYTRHFNYSVFPNFKIYSLSTEPQSNPVDSAAESAAADNTWAFSDPPLFAKALPSETEPEGDDKALSKQKHQVHKEQHQNLQLQLEQHKKQTERKHSNQKRGPLPLHKPSSKVGVEQGKVQPALPEGTTVPILGNTSPFQQAKVTETLFPPRTSPRDSSKSILFGGFPDSWMSNTNESALVLAAGPIGDPDAIQNKIRSVILKIRGPVADYQAKNGVPVQQQISFVDLIRMLFVCSQTAVFTILTMLWNLYPLLDGFLYVVRFVLDKTLHICQAETPSDRAYRTFVFTVQLMILLLANLFIVNIIILPITYLVLCTTTNSLRLIGIH